LNNSNRGSFFFFQKADLFYQHKNVVGYRRINRNFLRLKININGKISKLKALRVFFGNDDAFDVLTLSISTAVVTFLPLTSKLDL
jgi:hypothetical protein